MGALQNMGRRLFLDEPSALPELMISLIRDALAAVRRMRRMRRGLRTPQAVSSKLYMRNSELGLTKPFPPFREVRRSRSSSLQARRIGSMARRLTWLLAAFAPSLSSGLRFATMPAAQARQSSFRARAVTMEETQCAMIDLSTNDPLRVAQTLKKAWMEGAVKRGLVGSVLVPSENMVTIVAMGPRSRLDSFAEWIKTSSELVSRVTYDTDSCAVDPGQLSSKFKIADVESNAKGPWLEMLQQATIDVKDKGKKQSSDEGLV
jgi:acylphosphatase